MKIAIVGGGPSGLCFASLMKIRDPSHEITVYERNRATDTFGWGVVFSDKTLANLAKVDPVLSEQIVDQFYHWDDIDVHFKGTRTRTTGHGFVGIGRLCLLQLQGERARDLGIEVRYQTEIESIEALREEADLVIAADGLNSRVREEYAVLFKPEIDMRKNKFIWLGTKKLFEAFTFIFIETPHGWVQAHAYRFDDNTSTFIVECSEETWRAFDGENLSSSASIALCEHLFAEYLDGNGLMSNAKHRRGSEWITFPRVHNHSWHHENVVLLGDAAHTAHFSIGSGTKLGFEDAIELTEQLHRHDDLAVALDEYERVRRVDVERLKRAAEHSTEWFESVPRHAALEPHQFCYSLLTRSHRVGHANLRKRDPAWLAAYQRWFAARPLKLRGIEIERRISENLEFLEISCPLEERLEAVRVVRRGLPNDKPLAVRIWPSDFVDEADMVTTCRRYKEFGADIISVPTIACSDRIRNEVPIATLLTGVSDQGRATTAIHAGRADLCWLKSETSDE